MSNDTLARLRVAALIFSMVNAVLFGLGLITVLSVRVLSEQAYFWIPAVIVGSFILAPPIAWFIAPSMMQRFLKAKCPPIAAQLSTKLGSQTAAPASPRILRR